MDRYSLTEKQIAAEQDGKTIILQYDAEEYFGLDRVGSHIWSILETGPVTLDDLKAGVMRIFDVDEETCEKDIVALLDQLTDANLVKKEN